MTFGMKIPAGIFIPTMVRPSFKFALRQAVGSLFGRLVGLLTQYLLFKFPDSSLSGACHGQSPFDCVVPGIYAMVGAAAALAGVTRMTVSLAVISILAPFPSDKSV